MCDEVTVDELWWTVQNIEVRRGGGGWGGEVAFILSSSFYFVLLMAVFFWVSKMGKQEKNI